MTDSPWMTVKDAAKYTKWSEWTVRQAVKDGSLEAHGVRSGRGYRLHRDDLDKWMRSQPFEPGRSA